MGKKGSDGEEKARELHSQVGGGTKRESHERGILMEGAFMGSGRDLVLGKVPGIHRMNHAKTPSNSGKGV